jgi:hypothetical protein
MDKRQSNIGLFVAIVLLLTPMLYVGCYVGLGKSIPIYTVPGGYSAVPAANSQFVHVSRYYRTSWEPAIFRPLGQLEARVRGIEVRLDVLPPGLDGDL